MHSSWPQQSSPPARVRAAPKLPQQTRPTEVAPQVSPPQQPEAPGQGRVAARQAGGPASAGAGGVDTSPPVAASPSVAASGGAAHTGSTPVASLITSGTDGDIWPSCAFTSAVPEPTTQLADSACPLIRSGGLTPSGDEAGPGLAQTYRDADITRARGRTGPR